MSSDLRVLMKWDPQAENLCILHKNNQKYCSKSEELLCNDCLFTSLVAWQWYVFYLYRFYSSGFFHISWYIMDLQDVYCLIDSFCVCLSLIIPKNFRWFKCVHYWKMYAVFIRVVYQDFPSNTSDLHC